MADGTPKTKAETKQLTEKLLKERCVNRPGKESRTMLRNFQHENKRERITMRG